jgi:prepilin-type processing-associated H-X9-DG protein
MTVKFTNNANSTLSSGINSSVTSMTVADASSFPSLSGANDYCYLTLQESGGTTREIVKATARSSNTFTIVRGQDNTSAATWSSGILVELRITSALLQDVIDGLGSGSMMDTDIFTGDGSDTTFTLSRQPDNENNLLIFIDGVFQAHNAYSVSGTTLTLSAAPANGRVITAYHMATTVGGSNLIKATMTGDNNDVTLDVGSQIIHENNVQVYFDGVYQSKGNYSVSGSVITFSTAPPTGVAVEAILNTATNISTATQLADADSDTLIQVEESADEDKIRFDVAGTEEMVMDATGIIINDGSNDRDFRIESNGSANMLFVDGGNDEVVIQKASSGATATAGSVLIVEDDDNTELSILGGSSSVLAINFGHSGDNDEGKITFNTTAGSEDLQLVSSKEITLDAAGDITLDADGGDVNFKDGGTLYGFMAKSNNDLYFGNAISDGDVLVRGNDGGSNITALSFDMSEAGKATFNSGVTLGGDLDIASSGGNITWGSNYPAIGNIKSSQATLIGNNIKAGASNNTIVRHAHGSDAGNFIGITYNKGVTFHTGITTTQNTEVAETTNERVRINTSGFVGINDTSPPRRVSITGEDGAYSGQSSGNSRTHLLLENNGSNYMEFINPSGNSAGIFFSNQDAQNRGSIQYSSDALYLTQGGYDRAIIRPDGAFQTSDTNALVDFDSGGNRVRNGSLWGYSLRHEGTGANPHGYLAYYAASSPDSSASYPFYFTDSGAARFYVSSDGNIWTSDHGAITSDKTLKENIVDATPKLADIMKLKVRNFNWKKSYHPNSNEKMLGFIAQEFEEVFPSLIKETDIAPKTSAKDGEDHVPNMKKSVVTGALIPALVKAIQEQQALIETLQTEVKALKEA